MIYRKTLVPISDVKCGVMRSVREPEYSKIRFGIPWELVGWKGCASLSVVIDMVDGDGDDDVNVP